MLACGVMSGSGRGSLAHLRRPLALPLALAACALIAACGGGGKATAKATAARLVSQALTASGAVDSGRVAVALTLNLDGVKQLGGEPVTLDVSGPFQRGGSGQLAADLTATIGAAGTTASVEVVLLPGHVYLGIGGTFYDLPAPSTAGGQGATGRSGGIFGALGIDPHSWLTDPHDVGRADVGGVRTEQVSARVDVASLLGAAAKLGGGGTGSTGASGLAAIAPLLAQAITSARADVYTGVDDHIVRRLHVAVSFTVPALGGAALKGLTAGSLELDATLTDLGQPQTIGPPANVEPRSRLLNGIFDLESRFGSLASLFTGPGTSFGGLVSRHGSATS